MKANSEYLIFLPPLILLVIALFLLAGSLVVFRSKITIATSLLFFTSILSLTASVGGLYFSYKLFSFMKSGPAMFSSTSSAAFDELQKYTEYNSYMYFAYIAFLAIFAIAFTAFCCQIGNIRKRNEQLEFLVQELAEKKAEPVSAESP